jgi:hypothetical protein
MLSVELQTLLKLVAETKSTKQIDSVTKKIHELSPRTFFQGDNDPALARRVFYHQPASEYWSGRAITKEKAYGDK